MSLILKSSALLLAIACCSTASAQLAADISVATTREPDGRFRYEYLIENLPESQVAINAFVLDVGAEAAIESFDQPPGWTHDYDPAADPFELGWVAQGAPSAIPIGGNGTFSFTSPLEPGDILYFLANLAPDGSDLGSILDTVEGPLVAPLPGDYNGNGRVEQADLDLVLLNWGESHVQLPAEWVSQRPSMGIVDQAELDGVLLNWGNIAGATGSVPEPATWLMAIVACLAAVATRWQQRLDSVAPRGKP